MAMFYLATFIPTKSSRRGIDFKKSRVCSLTTLCTIYIRIAYQISSISAMSTLKIYQKFADFNGWKPILIAYNYTKLNQNDSAQRYQFLSNQHNPGFKIP